MPFNKHGDRQGGMKPADEDTKLVWEFVTQGATRTTPRTYRVLFEYLNDVPSPNPGRCALETVDFRT